MKVSKFIKTKPCYQFKLYSIDYIFSSSSGSQLGLPPVLRMCAGGQITLGTWDRSVPLNYPDNLSK